MKRINSKSIRSMFSGLVCGVVFCFLSIMLVPGIAQAVPGGIPVCTDKLNRFTADLGGCSSNLNLCTADLRGCSVNLKRCTDNLGMCSSDLNICTAELGKCTSDLIQFQKDLDQALLDLKACQDALDEYRKKPPAPVPMTGQDPNLFFFYSTPAGSDGNLQKGVAWPNPRFTDNGDGTVIDNLTGLFWLKNANCTAFSPEDSYRQNNRNWYDALRTVKLLASGNCGLKDGSLPGQWRLPNLRELLSLVHYGFAGPALPNTAGTQRWEEGVPFTGLQSDYLFWSSSSQANPDFRSKETAWGVDFFFGVVNIYNKLNQIRIWPVRSGN